MLGFLFNPQTGILQPTIPFGDGMLWNCCPSQDRMRDRNTSCLLTRPKCLCGEAARVGSDRKALFDKLLLRFEIIYFELSFIHSLTKPAFTKH